MLRNKSHETDPLWHVQLILAVVIVFQLILPDALIPWPRFLVPGLELMVLIVLQLVTPRQAVFTSRVRRLVVIGLIMLIALANVAALQVLVQSLFGHGHIPAANLLLAAGNVYITTAIAFALLYWEMDGGGPGLRRQVGLNSSEHDFLFPQQNFGKDMARRWHPTFVDYLFVSLTNMTAFSPTDTVPLSRRGKLVMATQALVALATVVLVAARAINTL